MSDDYADHLAARHAGWDTPPGIVHEVVAKDANASVVGLRRIVEGELNEVYDVTLDGASSLIMRISHGGREAFDREAWVLDECSARGIPAPQILAVRDVDVQGQRRTCCLMTKLEGARLCDLDLDEATTRRVLEELGAWLRQLHAIPVRGFGYLDGSGVGGQASVEEGLANLVDDAADFEKAGGAVGLRASSVRAWLDEIDQALRAAPPRITLIHNDLLAKHVLVQDGHLSGVIDFGQVAAEPAANDFAKWDFIEGDRFPVSSIQRGYDDPTLFAGRNERAYRALWLANGLWRMRWYHETGYRSGVEAARDRLVRGQADR